MYKIYYTNEWNEDRSYIVDGLEEALACVESVRKNSRNRFVTMVSENPNVVGKPGVDSVVDGKLPDGYTYSWTKRRKV